MPLVRISLGSGKTAQYKQAIADGVHRALIEVFNIPQADRFQLIDEHGAGDLIFDPSYLGIERTADIVILQIVVSFGRTADKKRALYRRIVELLIQKPGIRPQNVFIAVTEITKENWSFGNGVAQYAPATTGGEASGEPLGSALPPQPANASGHVPSAEVQAYIQRMHSFLDGRDPIDILAATLPAVERLVTSTDQSLLTVKPRPGTWCVQEILAHLADSEIVMGFRLRQIIAESGVAIQAYAQDKWAAAMNYISIPSQHSLERLRINRHANLVLLRSLPSDQLQNYGIHAERGRETVVDLMRIWAGHDANHLTQIKSLLAGGSVPA